MAKRNIIKIDKDKCTGCGLCIPNCPEGAMKIIDGKAHLISDLFCDGLGACLGHCPEGALIVEQREAENYNESRVMVNVAKQGENVIKAHLEHLKDHGALDYYNEAIAYLNDNNIKIPQHEGENEKTPSLSHSACPGHQVLNFKAERNNNQNQTEDRASQLQQWPIQMHLVPPRAPYFKGADVILAADCVAYSIGDFHNRFLKGKSLAIACPKLDQAQDIYIEKIKAMIDQGGINTLTVMTMEVPCCTGLLHIAQESLSKANKKIPLKSIQVSIRGQILEEKWL